MLKSKSINELSTSTNPAHLALRSHSSETLWSTWCPFSLSSLSACTISPFTFWAPHVTSPIYLENSSFADKTVLWACKGLHGLLWGRNGRLLGHSFSTARDTLINNRSLIKKDLWLFLEPLIPILSHRSWGRNERMSYGNGSAFRFSRLPDIWLGMRASTWLRSCQIAQTMISHSDVTDLTTIHKCLPCLTGLVNKEARPNLPFIQNWTHCLIVHCV